MDPIKLVHAKTRHAYDLEIKNERIFAIGRKVLVKGVHLR
jgi:hypothetical protein